MALTLRNRSLATALQGGCASLLLAAVSIAGAAAPASAPAAAAAPTAPGPLAPARKPDAASADIKITADGIEGNYKNQTADYKNVVIRQNDITVRADRAHGVGLTSREKSDWTLEGNVHVQSEEGGSLRSDQAVIELRNNLVTRVTVRGMPAEFEQKRANSDQVERGHADEIVYDVSDGTVRLSNNAWLSDGRSEMTSELFVYNIRSQQVEGSTPAGGKRVEMTISPASKTEPKKTEPKPNP